MDEPILDNFYAMISKADNLPPYLYYVVSKEKIDLFLSETIPDITQSEIDKIINYLPVPLRKEVDKLTLLVIQEIDFNVVKLSTSDQVKRYLDHTYDYLSIAIDKINYNSCHSEIDPLFRNFCHPQYLEKLKKDENYVNHKFEPDEWKPPFLETEFSQKEKISYYSLSDLLSNIDFFESEFSMVLYHIEGLQIKYGFKENVNVYDELVLTHRQNAIIDKYKTDAKYTDKILKRTEIKNQFGKGREKAIDSVNELSKAYKPITAKELEIIIPHLVEYPNAQKAAINDLHKLN